MPVCRNCGVQIDEGLARCPLCQAPENGAGAPPPPTAGRISGGRSAPLTRRRLWEIVSLFAGTGAAASLLLFLRRRRLLLHVAGTVVLAAFLLALDLLMPGRPWSPTLALPLTALVGLLLYVQYRLKATRDDIRKMRASIRKGRKQPWR